MTVHLSATEAGPVILQFWFDEVGKDRWFVKDATLDAEIGRRFGGLRDRLLANKARSWRDTPEHLLAAILLLDQCSRNIHRGSAKAFEADALALELTELALAKGWSNAGPPERRQFFLMPLMHSEDPAVQDRSVAEFERLGDPLNLDFAREHRDQIARFGRFPGRNAALGRRTTGKEQRSLDAGAVF